MGSLIRKRFTKPAPAGAMAITKGGKTFARWVDSAGEHEKPATITAKGLRLVGKSAVWVGRYRDASGVVRERSTGCRHKQAAMAVLNEWQRLEERIASGLVTPCDLKAVSAAAVPLATHIEEYIAWLIGQGRSQIHCRNTRMYIDRAVAALGWVRLPDMNRSALEKWLAMNRVDGVTNRTSNGYHTALNSFGAWLVREGRIGGNPFAGMRKMNPGLTPKRPARVYSENEILLLLDAAIRRPLESAMERMTKPLTPERREQLVFEGHERALCYRILLGMGLRWAELKCAKVKDYLPDGPSLVVLAQNEKARRGATLPVPRDVADKLNSYLRARLRFAQRKAGLSQKAVPLRLNPDDLLIPVPELPALYGDLEAAGIERVNEYGRLHFHSMRHTFITRLAASGAHPKTMQMLARHADAALTLNRYTHLSDMDLRKAIDSVPDLKTDDASAAAVANDRPIDSNASSTGLHRLPPNLALNEFSSMQFGATRCANGVGLSLVEHLNQTCRAIGFTPENAREFALFRAGDRAGRIPGVVEHQPNLCYR